MMSEYRLKITPALEVGPSTIIFNYARLQDLVVAEIHMAKLLLFLHEIKAMPDHSNMFIREHFIDGEWQELE